MNLELCKISTNPITSQNPTRNDNPGHSGVSGRWTRMNPQHPPYNSTMYHQNPQKPFVSGLEFPNAQTMGTIRIWRILSRNWEKFVISIFSDRECIHLSSCLGEVFSTIHHDFITMSTQSSAVARSGHLQISKFPSGIVTAWALIMSGRMAQYSKSFCEANEFKVLSTLSKLLPFREYWEIEVRIKNSDQQRQILWSFANPNPQKVREIFKIWISKFRIFEICNF